MGNPFRGETITQVSSAIYNLAGDVDVRDSFIKKTVFQSVFMEEKPEIAQSISSAIIHSKGFNLRHYIYWLNNNDNGTRFKKLVGYESSEIGMNTSLNENDLAVMLKPSLNECVKIKDAEMKGRKASWFGGIWLASEHPGYEDYDFKIDFSSIVDEHQTMTVKVPVPGEEQEKTYTVTLPFIKNGKEILPLYKKRVKYVYAQYQTYACQDANNNNVDDEYEADLADYNAAIAAIEQGAEGISPGLPPTPPGPNPEDPYQYFIYMKGSDPGSIYEYLFPGTSKYDTNQLVPPIPFRLNNKQVSERAENKEENMEELYKLSKTAFRKVYNDSKGYKNLEKSILEDENVGDFDFIYIFFGVPINTQNFAGKEYLYRFFKRLHDYTSGSSGEKEFHVEGMKWPMNFSYTIEWAESSYNPKKAIADLPKKIRPTFDKNKKYATKYYHDAYDIPVTREVDGETITEIQHVDNGYYFYVFHKLDDKNVSYIWFKNLVHKNEVYDGYDVETTLRKAFTYGDEGYKESSFLVPIHEGVFREMSPINQAEIGEVFAFLVFNYYQKTRVKWYASSSFRSFITIFPMGISSFMIPWSIANNLAAASFTTATQSAAQYTSQEVAKIVFTELAKKGLQALALMAIAQITMKLLAPLLGAKWATLIGTVAAFIAVVRIGGKGVDNFSLFETLTQAKNLIGLGVAIVDGYGKGIQAETAQAVAEGQEEIQKLQKATVALQQEYKDFIDIRDWASEKFFFDLRSHLSPETWYMLTTQTGADVARDTIEITLNFPALSISTELAY